jgi:tRNA threonylcarbamoyladenosine biosynthesis protein TsaE
MVTLISHSPEETQEIGEAWGREAQPGWVIGLTGELGAGKTQLVKGLARGLGINERVHSPTFALLNEYQGDRGPLFHLDLYRLETPEQIVAAGLEEFLIRPSGIAVVEWAERWPAFERADEVKGQWSKVKGFANLRRAVIETVDDTTRRISYEDLGA